MKNVYWFMFLLIVLVANPVIADASEEHLTLEEQEAKERAKNQMTAIIIASIALVITLTLFFTKKIGKNLLIPLLFVVIVSGLIGFSFATISGDQIDEGITTCDAEGNCVKSLHWHSYYNIMICGGEIKLPKNEGALDDLHTHKEVGKYHIHERFPVTSEEEFIDSTPFTIGHGLNELGLLQEGCINGVCEGDLCNGEDGSWKITGQDIDGNIIMEDQPLNLDHVWNDEDKYEIVFEVTQ